MEIKGELLSHRYETLIPRWLYQACQEVRLNHNKKQFQYAGKEFVFQRLITCATAGHTVTLDTKTRIYPNLLPKQLTYLRCWKPEDPQKLMWVREEKVLEQVEDVLKRIGIKNKKILNDTLLYMKETNRLKK